MSHTTMYKYDKVLCYITSVCPACHFVCLSVLPVTLSVCLFDFPLLSLCLFPCFHLKHLFNWCDYSFQRPFYNLNINRERHKAERRAAHRRLPLPNGRMKPRQKRTNRFSDVPMPYSVLVVLGCVLACCGLCLVILFVFCPPTRNRCITIMGEWMRE
jgi:hypothetical protein